MWFRKSDRLPQNANPGDQSSSMDNGKFIQFLYLIFFDRDAEDSAIDHWKAHLDAGLPPIELFRALLNSAEFATKVEQNRYFRAPRLPDAAKAAESTIVTTEFFNDVIKMMEKDRERLLEIGVARAAIAQWRYRDLMQSRGVTTVTSAERAVPETIEYSQFTLGSYVGSDRSNQMIRPLLSIGRVFENVADLKVLSIGPRTEMELFALLAAGFALPNIMLIDLFSYSPFIRVGDMHQIDSADNQFDIIVFGDVLAYSKTPEVAVGEIVRVARHKAIITTGHGVTKGHVPLFCKDQKPGMAVDPTMGLRVQSTEDIIGCFRPHVGHIYFRCEPEDVKEPIMNRVLTVFEILKL
jgi:SAM-dependent methyltransferase